MRANEQALEKEIQAANPTEHRLTPEDISAKIKSVQYHRFPGTTVTVAALTLENGFTVLGESAAADEANFREEIGRKVAFDNARSKIWALEGYLLRERLSQVNA